MWAISRLERRRHEVVLARVKGRLLDIGCGENRLVRQYGNGVGVDVVDWGDVDLVVEDSANLPFPDESFDTISLVACLNHIPKREETLHEASRLLKDDGLLLVTMIPPLVSTVWHRVVRGWDPDQSHRDSHDGEVSGFTPREMTRMLKRNGFSVVVHERFIARMNNLFVAEKTTNPTKQFQSA
jgi:SAM-dependent methyltransferase